MQNNETTGAIREKTILEKLDDKFFNFKIETRDSFELIRLLSKLTYSYTNNELIFSSTEFETRNMLCSLASTISVLICGKCTELEELEDFIYAIKNEAGFTN